MAETGNRIEIPWYLSTVFFHNYRLAFIFLDLNLSLLPCRRVFKWKTADSVTCVRLLIAPKMKRKFLIFEYSESSNSYFSLTTIYISFVKVSIDMTSPLNWSWVEQSLIFFDPLFEVVMAWSLQKVLLIFTETDF